MTLFWILAATLLLVALAALLRPLLRPRAPAQADASAASNVRILREQLAELDAELAAGTLAPDQHRTARVELERRVLEEAQAAEAPAQARSGRASAAVLALALPLLAVGLYATLGNRNAFDPILSKPTHEATAADVEVLVERLAQRMRAQPGDPDGWVLLGRTYASLQRFEPARDAYAQAVRLVPDNPHLLADYADAMAMTQGRRLAGEPERLVMQALAIDPDHLKALALAGSAAMERQDYANAVKHWSRLKAVAPPESPFANGMDDSLQAARAAAGLPPDETLAAAPSDMAVPSAPPLPAAPGNADTPAASGAAVRVRVSLAPALAARVQPGDTLFVFARAAEGPRMPLAIARRGAGELPLEVTLDDSSAMSPAMRLSAFERVVIGARISRSGNAVPQSGDLEGQSPPIPSAATPSIDIVIDTARE